MLGGFLYNLGILIMRQPSPSIAKWEFLWCNFDDSPPKVSHQFPVVIGRHSHASFWQVPPCWHGFDRQTSAKELKRLPFQMIISKNIQWMGLYSTPEQPYNSTLFPNDATERFFISCFLPFGDRRPIGRTGWVSFTSWIFGNENYKGFPK